MSLQAVLLLALLTHTFAAHDSCKGRCNDYDRDDECQCDSSCDLYKNCCPDYKALCGKMGSDTHQQLVFFRPQPRPETLQMFKPRPPMGFQKLQETPAPTHAVPSTDAAAPTTVPMTTSGPTEAPDPDAVVCSGRPFDSFMQLKNGSIFAFRGEYFFELNQKSVLPGYPKLIKDVWGISGPIDAAFTRVNCQGKTYIFKGNKYWRFDNGVLEDDYPRDINVGFERIPDYVDAAFALPAPGHNGREKVYFFKGDQYYTYEFLHRPSPDECITMSEKSPPTLYKRYNDLYDNNYEDFMSELFSGLPQHHDKHHFIDKDWKGLRSPVDAVMADRMYIPPSTLENRLMEMGLRLAERRMEMEERLGRDWDQDRGRDDYSQNNGGNDDSRHDKSYGGSIQGSQPIQGVYFFRKDMYYRVNLKTKRVEFAVPPYPRSIARYWLGCSGNTGEEK